MLYFAVMHWLRAFITIIRLPNLIFIFLTQILVYKYLIVPTINSNTALLNTKTAFLLALSTTLIAAAGYIINDYFDVKIDEINKPHRVTVELKFKRRWIMGAHILLNIIALAIALPLALACKHISLIGLQLLCITYLIAYSAQLKREAFTGNLCIATLTGLLVLTPALYENTYLKNIQYTHYHSNFMLLLFFAFTITWLREIAKDLEDLKGDAADGCTTMPIKYGISFAKNTMLLLTILLIIAAMAQIVIISNTVIFKVATLVLVLLPSIYLLLKINRSFNQVHFKQLSNIIKAITFAGILIIILV